MKQSIGGLKPLKIGCLTARRPVIQGGMGVGISLSSLAGAVAKAGGIGIISTAQIGFQDPDFEKNARFFQKIAQIETSVPFNITLDQLKLSIDQQKRRQWYEYLEFYSLLKTA